MRFLLSVPTLLCGLIMAAHFFRAWSFCVQLEQRGKAWLMLALVAISLLVPMLLLAPGRHSLRVVQAALVLAAAEMAWTGVRIMRERIADGNPDVAAPGVIMGCVAGFCLLSAVLAGWAPRGKRRGELRN